MGFFRTIDYNGIYIIRPLIYSLVPNRVMRGITETCSENNVQLFQINILF